MRAEWIRAIFLSSGHTGVTKSGQYRASGSQGVQLALTGGGGGGGGQSGTWLLNRCCSGRDIKMNHNFLLHQEKVCNVITYLMVED